MTKFPFVVGPKSQPIVERIGSDSAGYIEIKRQGFLSAGERAAMQQVTSQDDSTKRILNLVRLVATKHGLDMEAAYREVSAAMGGAPGELGLVDAIMDEWATDVNEIISTMQAVQIQQRMVKAYILTAFRISSEITYDECSELHPDILDGLVELYDAEDARSIERLAAGISSGQDDAEEGATAQNVELAEKKPVKKAKRASTSLKSSGN